MKVLLACENVDVGVKVLFGCENFDVCVKVLFGCENVDVDVKVLLGCENVAGSVKLLLKKFFHFSFQSLSAKKRKLDKVKCCLYSQTCVKGQTVKQKPALRG